MFSASRCSALTNQASRYFYLVTLPEAGCGVSPERPLPRVLRFATLAPPWAARVGCFSQDISVVGETPGPPRKYLSTSRRLGFLPAGGETLRPAPPENPNVTKLNHAHETDERLF